MNVIRKTASFEQRAQRLEISRQKYITFRDEIERTFKLKKDDCRLSFLKNTISLTRGAVILNFVFHRCGVDSKFGVNFFGLSDSSSIGPQVRNMAKFTRLSWCVMFQFQLENLLGNILKELGETVPSRYYKVAEKITYRLRLPNKKHTIRRLSVIAYIRNSLHANGIHKAFNKEDTVIQVDKVQFSFNHLKTVKCATWDHIAHAWTGLLPVIRKIYFHGDVACLVNIPNQFTSI